MMVWANDDDENIRWHKVVPISTVFNIFQTIPNVLTTNHIISQVNPQICMTDPVGGHTSDNCKHRHSQPTHRCFDLSWRHHELIPRMSIRQYTRCKTLFRWWNRRMFGTQIIEWLDGTTTVTATTRTIASTDNLHLWFEGDDDKWQQPLMFGRWRVVTTSQSIDK